jgi:circadian clock protein KaiC
MLMRLVDFMKASQVTALFTSLTQDQDNMEKTDVGLSSLMDTWLLLRNIEASGERNRGLYVLKSRGMAHSNQIREFVLTDHGVELQEVYLGPAGVLTGSARVAQETHERTETLARRQEMDRKRYNLERKRQALDAKIAMLRAEFEAEVEEMQEIAAQDELRERQLLESRGVMAQSRGAGDGAKPRKGARR